MDLILYLLIQRRRSGRTSWQRKACARDILIAEVGVWNSPNNPDPEKAKEALTICEEQLRLAEYVGARCCVNVSGAAGPVWHACYRENYTGEIYRRNVETVQYLCDRVKPVRTFYTLEVMQWMLPDSPEQYLKFIRDVDRDGFAVHMDEAFRLLGDKVKRLYPRTGNHIFH